MVVALVVLTSALQAVHAQEFEPRTYAVAPVNVNFVGIGYGFATGGVFLDPALPVDDVEGDVHVVMTRYVRTLSLFNRPSKVKVAIPWSSGDWEGIFEDEQLTRSASGLADARVVVETLFHGVAMKPGKPILAGRARTAGRSGNGFVLGLPGNPLSVFVGFRMFGEPVLKALSGIPGYWPVHRTVRLTAGIRRKPGRETYHLATVMDAEATPVTSTGSGDVMSLPRANALVVTDADATDAPAGATLRAFLF